MAFYYTPGGVRIPEEATWTMDGGGTRYAMDGDTIVPVQLPDTQEPVGMTYQYLYDLWAKSLAPANGISFERFLSDTGMQRQPDGSWAQTGPMDPGSKGYGLGDQGGFGDFLKDVGPKLALMTGGFMGLDAMLGAGLGAGGAGAAGAGAAGLGGAADLTTLADLAGTGAGAAGAGTGTGLTGFLDPVLENVTALNTGTGAGAGLNTGAGSIFAPATGGLPQLPPTPNLPGTNAPTLPTVPGGTETIPPGWQLGPNGAPIPTNVINNVGGIPTGTGMPSLPGAPTIPGVPGGTGTGTGGTGGGGSGGFDWTSFLGNSLGAGLGGLLNYRTAQEMMGIGAPFRTAAQNMVTNPDSWYSGPLGQATTRAVMQGRSAMAPGGTQDIMNAAGALGAYNQHLGTLLQGGGLGLNQGAQFQANFNQLPGQIAGAAGAASGPSANDWFRLLQGGNRALTGVLGGTGTNINGADDAINFARQLDANGNWLA